MANTLKFGNGNWAIKEDSTLAYSDQYDNFKPLPFDFTRASNATVVNKEGLIETVGNGIPRIDFLDSEDGALLLEPQRTNLVTYSEDFSSSWASSGTNPPVLTPSQFISPDGTQNASRLQIPITNTTSILQQLFSHTSGQEYTVSAYVKSNSSSNQEFKLYGDYGVPTGISGVLIATSEWQRFTFTYTATGTGSRSGGFYYVPNTNTDIQIYGFQAEQGSYATSYIPTSGSAVTRVRDICENNWNGLDVETESFSFYIEFNINHLNSIIISKKQNLGATDGWALQVNSSGILKLYVFANGTEKTAQYSGFNLNVNHKVVGIIDRENDLLNLYVNGALKQSTDISAITGTLLSTYNLRIGTLGDGSIPTSIKNNSFNYYNNVLTDQEAIALTQV